MDENIIISAHHEAGHALMAYICGWTIDSILLKIENEKLICGVTNYDFGEDKMDTPTNLNRRIYCLMGGPISEALYTNNDRIDFSTLQQDGITINNLLSNFDTQVKETIIQDAINATATILSFPANKKAKNLIAEILIRDHKISQAEFMKLLSGCNIKRMDF